MQRKVTVEKRLKRAGATRLFWLPAAQKVLGVAPALDAISVGLFSTVTSAPNGQTDEARRNEPQGREGNAEGGGEAQANAG